MSLSVQPDARVLALGSNLGQQAVTLAGAVQELRSLGFHTDRSSSLYLTEPVGGPEQEWYINQVVAGQTSLSPDELLEACNDVEHSFGRVRGVKNAPRTLDIDILFYGQFVHDSPGLTLPHKRLHERRFVLVPLAEVAPDFFHPRLGLTVRELLARCEDRSRVLLHASAGSAR